MTSTPTSPPGGPKPKLLLIDCTDEAWADPAEQALIAQVCKIGNLLTPVRAKSIACPGCGLLAWEGYDCEHCEIMAVHAFGCAYRTAATCAIPIPCDAHQIETCEECDACDCGTAAAEMRAASYEDTGLPRRLDERA